MILLLPWFILGMVCFWWWARLLVCHSFARTPKTFCSHLTRAFSFHILANWTCCGLFFCFRATLPLTPGLWSIWLVCPVKIHSAVHRISAAHAELLWVFLEFLWTRPLLSISQLCAIMCWSILNVKKLKSYKCFSKELSLHNEYRTKIVWKTLL